MGIMLLVFMPLPYVDASSAWAFRSKWHRVVVGAAGMFWELAIAAVAAIVWASVGPGVVQALAYNCMFIASVTTLLFNGNPLLRYDGYYILSDLLEIPNLAQRSKSYLYYLVKRYIWRVRNPRNPANTAGERAWFVFYGIASTIYRVFILIMILLFLSDRLPEQLKIIATIAAAVSGLIWLCAPIFKFIKYLAISGELARVRGRAVLSTLVVVIGIAMLVGVWRIPDRVRTQGVVKPLGLAFVHVRTDGYINNFLPSGTPVAEGRDALVNAPPASPEARPAFLEGLNGQLTATLASLKTEHAQLRTRWRWAMDEKSYSIAQSLAGQIAVKAEQIERITKDLDHLTVRAPIPGVWISPDVDRLKGSFLKRGQQIGLVADLRPANLIVLAVASQEIGAPLQELYKNGQSIPVEMRVRGRPTVVFSGEIRKMPESGQETLPSAALGHAAGGPVVTRTDDKRGLTAAESFFKIPITPHLGGTEDPARAIGLLPDQRIVVRFEMPPKPLAVQLWRKLLQLLQKKR